MIALCRKGFDYTQISILVGRGKDAVRTTDGSSGFPSYGVVFLSCSGACGRNHGEAISEERTFVSTKPVTYPLISHTLDKNLLKA